MKRFKDNINDRQKMAKNIRALDTASMQKEQPSDSAKWQMKHKPYAARELIKKQGEQMERKEV